MSAGDEDELESYLQRRALLRAHRSYQEQLEPPPELDRIVLRKARLAIQSRAAQQGPSPAVVLPLRATTSPAHRRRWYAPASFAASVLVCMTILVDLGAHALRNDEPDIPQLHEEAAESVASQASVSVLAKADVRPTPAVYTGAPIFEVVIRTARLTGRPVSDTPRSADPTRR
jgi:hypothetical protein